MSGSGAVDRDTAIQTDPVVWLLNSRQRDLRLSNRLARLTACLARQVSSSGALDSGRAGPYPPRLRSSWTERSSHESS
jgi:hypothetical protein